MFDELNNKIAEIKERLREKQRNENLITIARKKLDEQKKHLNKLSKILDKEKYDVKKLETLSITGLFYELLGTKEKRLDKERQEFIAAKLKHDSCKSTLVAIEGDIHSLENHIKKHGDPETEYKNILKEKETLLLKSEDKKTSQFLENLVDLNMDKKEITEALTAGTRVLKALEDVILLLKGAKNWGTFDLLGGGLIATAVKHSKMDKAKQAISKVQSLLHKFHQELSDVKISSGTKMGVDISSFNTFADYFFDGLIFDWIVQSKINRSLQNSLNLRKDLCILKNGLKNQLNEVDNKIKQLEQEKTEFLETLK